MSSVSDSWIYEMDGSALTYSFPIVPIPSSEYVIKFVLQGPSGLLKMARRDAIVGEEDRDVHSAVPPLALYGLCLCGLQANSKRDVVQPATTHLF